MAIYLQSTRDIVRSKYKAHLSIQEICRDTGISYLTVYTWCKDITRSYTVAARITSIKRAKRANVPDEARKILERIIYGG